MKMEKKNIRVLLSVLAVIALTALILALVWRTVGKGDGAQTDTDTGLPTTVVPVTTVAPVTTKDVITSGNTATSEKPTTSSGSTASVPDVTTAGPVTTVITTEIKPPVTTTVKPTTTTTVKPQTTTTTKPRTTTTAPDPVDPRVENPGNVTMPEYKNPLITVTTENAWQGYGVGDPFVMRWNGRYYLYNSTKDGQIGIQCWTSDDLVIWRYVGLCATEELTKTAYAPEVTYYNGKFYMYTSPSGKGHYVLESDSPTGPFRSVTGNWGHSIDGHVFIDDDGRWYFYSADGSGIKCYNMSSPKDVSRIGRTVTPNINGNWTEGPMVIKYDGKYYITYTGNHVWSKGYRINYAVGDSCTSFAELSNNPLLVSTSSAVYGIGHSSTVMGPNMDSYYIVYHSIAGGTPRREMRIDRIVFNGKYMEVLGPSTVYAQKPEMPDVYSYFGTGADLSAWNLKSVQLSGNGILVQNGGRVVTKKTFGNYYTAECNFMKVGSRAGIIFSYNNDSNYGTAVFDRSAQTLVVTFVVNGEKYEYTTPLTKSFGENVNFDSLQLLTVKKNGSRFTFYVNNRELCSHNSSLGGGSFGAMSADGASEVGFTAITGNVNQSSIRDFYKPISGRLQATTCRENDYPTESGGERELLTVRSGSVYNYRVKVGATGGYDLTVKYKSTSETVLRIYQSRKKITDITLPSTGGRLSTVTFRNLSLAGGYSAISFECMSGSASVGDYLFEKYQTVKDFYIDCESPFDDNIYRDGSWSTSGGKLLLDGGSKSVGKRLYGSENYGDYTFEADITPIGGSINAGVLVRAKNAAIGGNGVDNADNVVAGTDFVQGYFIGLTKDSVVLGKQNYGWTQIKSVAAEISFDKTYRLKVSAIGSTIKVWLDGKLMIEYTDDDPFTQGAVGLRGHYSIVKFDNLTLKAE